jgi:rhamnose utilization protein RhaD (predicted bifunctional aldolase and dehydrogenase)
LEAFLRVSAELGANPRHVQGPGGNTSLKLESGRMRVKASGFELRFAECEDIFAEVDHGAIRASLRAGASDPLVGAFAPGGPKPSIETSMHALLPQRVVLHTHSLPVIVASCRTDAREHVAARLGDDASVFVEYARPGTPLALGVMRALDAAPNASVVVLQNHGLVVGADTAEAALAELYAVCEQLEPAPRTVEPAVDHSRLELLADEHALALPADERIHRLAFDDEAVRIATGGTLYPDHVVFLGSGAGLLADRPAPGSEPRGPGSPKLWIAPGAGVLFEPGLPKAAEALALCLVEVALGLPSRAACRYLSARDEAEVLGMEEEKYRQALASRGR